MSTTVEAAPRAPEQSDRRAPAPGGKAAAGTHPDAILLATAALVVTACLPLTRVFVGLAFLRPVLAAALVSLGVSWVSRRLGAGPVTTLVASGLAWTLFVALAFLPDTLAYGLLPTLDTLGAGRDLWLHGIELIRIRPAPAFAEAGMLLITASGVWWVAHAVDGLVFRLQAPLRAIAMALVLWAVPLAMARDQATTWMWATPLLAAAAWLLLATGGSDLARWGLRVVGQAERRGPDHLTSSGTVIAIVAIAAGALLGGLLPGFDEPPFYQVRSLSGTTITTNPIVSLRANLVSQSPTPVARVRTGEPIYLRLTALDVYGEREEWTSGGIRGGPATGRLPFETELPAARDARVEVTAEGLEGAIIVPVPYQPVELSGPAAENFQYDRDGVTVTLATGEGLAPGDRYEVQAAIPDPPADMLAAASMAGTDPRLVALPGNVPDEVVTLAERIVAAAGAQTAFDQALAIQDELRSWTYSLEPPQGHGGGAMRAFIENRVGYCEQFAGTMAVMLRSLGIPARVAVGFTPGDLVGDDGATQEWLVTQANAHAWVEVLFPGAGWVAFEPTPRSDGNVLTPTATNLAPSAIDAQADAGLDPLDDLGGLADPETLEDLVPDVSGLDGTDAASLAAGGAGDGGGRLWALVAVLSALVAVALVAGAARGVSHSRQQRLPPAARVLRATDQVRRIGRGLGRPPGAAETDREYLTRLSRGTPASRTLAEVAACARYATALTADDAAEAERSAATLIAGLLEDQPTLRRALARVRGPVSGAASAAWARLTTDGSPAPDWQQSNERLRRLVQRRGGRSSSGR